MRLTRLMPALVAALTFTVATAQRPHILQRPALSAQLIAFSYAGDLWTVPRAGGTATRLTSGVGIETAPVFSPDGQTLAFTADYDGNVDVFTVPVTGGVPHRVTYHPSSDSAVGWTPDGKNILFRSSRAAVSRYYQLFTVPAVGGQATLLPLPMAYQGSYAPDGGSIAYTPLPQAFGFDYSNYTAWGNYRGGRAGTVWITTLPGLESVEVPHETASDFSPVFAGGKVYFLSGRGSGNSAHIGVWSYDPKTKAVAEVFHNTGTDLHSLSSDGKTLVFDQLGELYLLDPAEGVPHAVNVDVTADLPEVRAHLMKVGDEVQHASLSPSGLRVAFEAHGEILTVPAKHGPVRNLTNAPGSMERAPAWAPDGQSVAFFSDATADGKPGLYSLHIVPQTGGTAKVIALGDVPAYYFSPVWSPDSKHISFQDEHGQQFLVDVETAKFTKVSDSGMFGGFSDQETAVAWSPDSHWLVYPKSMPNHLHALYLYELGKGGQTQLTGTMAEATSPAFDRNGKYLYFIASNNAGATSDGLDMTSDLYTVTRSIYSLSLLGTTASPIAPESDDEKSAAEVKEKAKENKDTTPAGEADKAKEDAKKDPDEAKKKDAAKPEPTKIDLAGMSVEAIAGRIAALPMKPAGYDSLSTGKPGTLYFIEQSPLAIDGNREGGATLSRFVLEGRKTEKLADHVAGYEVSADGEKMLVALAAPGDGPGGGGPPHFVIQPANAPIKPGDGAVSTAGLEVRVDPAAEWRQMYHEVWRIERAYFYDAHFHGVDTVAMEKKLAPYADAIASRADLNYIFQEMLSAFSVGHLRGSGGAIPTATKVSGGLLGADYVIENNRYCISKIYTGGSWSPNVKAPLAQPGLNVHPGLCILAIDGQPLTAATDIQQALEGTAGHAVTLKLGGPKGEEGARDITVVPVASEYALRNTDWIDGNQKKVDALSGGKLAYVYLPDTGEGGFTNFNRYYFAQLDKQGAIIDERFNAGGQVADYIVEVLGRHIESYWSPRSGAIEHTPNAGIYGPKVMIANEYSGSGGDALPWLFKQNKLGPLVGKRTWGGLVGIGEIPVLMDGGNVTSPSVAFFSPEGKWDVENHGVDPDVSVEQDPKAVAEGHDPQLEKAVALAMEQLKAHPAVLPQRPAYPVYTY